MLFKMNMRILITGSGGFLGYHLLKLFEKKKKHQLFALYNRNKPVGLNKTTKLVKADLAKINFTDYYNLVIHCASKTPVNAKNDKIASDDNINSLQKILKKVNFDNFVFMSSTSVYGNHSGIKINEKTKFINNDYYGKSKIECEKLLEKFSNKEKKNILVLRLPAVVGIKSHSNFISNLMVAYKENKPDLLTINNIEDLYNNTVHAEEVYDFIKIMINKKIKNFYNVFILGSKTPIRLKNLISIYDDYYKKKIKLKYIINKNKNNIIDFSKALKFGFKPIKTSDTILKMLKDNNNVK